MNRFLIFGNSGAGKSTLARKLSQQHHLAHLDLDILAWLPKTPPARRPLVESSLDIEAFISGNPGWVIEGCYADLLAVAAPHCSELIFLNSGIEACVSNCRSRPWEPHKYSSKEAQDANLDMLVGWIREYATRTDEFSLSAHRRLFDGFKGKKSEWRAL
jgi:adenylate kinase family enzyme